MVVPFRATVDPRSAAAVQAALAGVKAGVQNRVVKGGVGKAARQAAKQAKQTVKGGPTGAYKAAIGTKYKAYRQKQTWVFVVGARKNMARPNPRPFGPATFDPTKYAHLVEDGRKSVAPVKARFLRFYPRPKGLDLVFTRRPVAAVAGSHQIARQTRWLRGPGAGLAVNELLRLFRLEVARYAAKGKSVYGP